MHADIHGFILIHKRSSRMHMGTLKINIYEVHLASVPYKNLSTIMWNILDINEVILWVKGKGHILNVFQLSAMI